jgi:hypothetical protein
MPAGNTNINECYILTVVMNLVQHPVVMGCFAGEPKAHGIERYHVKADNLFFMICLYFIWLYENFIDH